jgi:type VI secretion system protein ImpE
MSLANVAEQTLKGGDPLAALTQLQEQVRAKPADFKLRIFLFQLLCVVGHWERALNQLNVASNLDPSAIGMAQMYGDAIRCEAIRVEVFDGKKSPMIFGQPDQWLALLIESLLVGGRGEPERSHELRARAFEEAPTTQGSIDGKPFEWIADADSRLGPVLEAVINGRYYWVPFSRLLKIEIEPPEDLRDVVWMPARLEFENGGASVALIPTRYSGSQSSNDGLIALARKTVWEEIGPDTHRGLGQRILATDTDEIPLMEARTITLSGDSDATAAGAGDHA